MKNFWFTSDTHFFHENILTFTGNDLKRIRPDFNSVEEMNEFIVDKWNSVVKPGDHVYHLGDVAIGKVKEDQVHQLLRRLNGRKRLILGNHDNGLARWVATNFEKVMLWRNFDEFTCSHIPLRLDQLRRRHCNVHGHIHQNLMAEPNYINVCVEQTNYTPVAMEEIVAKIKERGL